MAATRPTVIPAQAGIQHRGIVPPYRNTGYACILDSRLRGNDGYICTAMTES